MKAVRRETIKEGSRTVLFAVRWVGFLIDWILLFTMWCDRNP